MNSLPYQILKFVLPPHDEFVGSQHLIGTGSSAKVKDVDLCAAVAEKAVKTQPSRPS